MSVKETHIAKELNEPIRIQEYAVGIFTTVKTKSAVKKAIKNKLILVNDLPTTTAKIIIGGDKITLLNSIHTPHKKKLVFRLKIIFEDEYLGIHPQK